MITLTKQRYSTSLFFYGAIFHSYPTNYNNKITNFIVKHICHIVFAEVHNSIKTFIFDEFTITFVCA